MRSKRQDAGTLQSIRHEKPGCVAAFAVARQ